MSLKFLKDKRQGLINDLELMVANMETEKRNLSDEELTQFRDKKKEIEKIDETIAEVEEVRYNEMTDSEKVVETEKRSRDEIEKRALEAFFKGEDITEYRTLLTTTGNNQATIPVTIAEGLLKKLEEQCPILAEGRRFSSKGILRLLSETSYGEGAMTEENAKFHEDDVEFGFIELSAYKISTSVKMSFELLKNSSLDLNDYLTDVIVRRLAREINKYFLIGTGNKQPQGLIQGTQTVEVGTDLTYDVFVKMITSLHPKFLEGAKFIMNRATFTKVALLEDGNGHKYLQNGVVNGKFVYTIAGVPIMIDNYMPNYEDGKRGLILANVADCYTINMLQDIVVKRLDQIEFLNGVDVFAGYIMADGKITNEDALIIANVKASVAGASVEMASTKKATKTVK